MLEPKKNNIEHINMKRGFKNILLMKKKTSGTSHNKRYTLRRLFGGSGFRLARSVASLTPTPASTHIFAALVLLRKPLFGLQKRHIPRTLYAILYGVTGRIGNGFVVALR